MTTSERIASIRIRLDHIKPVIWRSVEVPITTSLKGLHDVIQAVMLFEDYHLFEFEVDDKRYGIPDPEEHYGGKTRAARNVRIGALIERGIKAFSYTYDFGDDWQHTITIEAVTDADPAAEYPRFIDGERRAPPEDVGGSTGFEDFLQAMAKPRHLTTELARLAPLSEVQARLLAQRLSQVPGVAEAVVVPDEAVAYLKLDQERLNRADLDEVLADAA